jgi:hypothetical protein
MALPRQTIALLEAARQLAEQMPAEAVLLLTETNLDWDAVLGRLGNCRLLVAAQDSILTKKLKEEHGLTVLDIDPGPTPTQERMSLALLEAIAQEKLQHWRRCAPWSIWRPRSAARAAKGSPLERCSSSVTRGRS